ncbi:GGDEF domain-containing protein [Chitinilyticum piscinae]|uniref:diguanylate cyclase n=1 Tax=Chitinilyticum piscinae TaxID=2866724 RepID=A0A8J7K964_9NEIS|nr:GGDEF domain-containing protein [Chitinilyticum piscinae]MBE9610723.1 GGDEF domain-containing protein [Chitinilyticum piscinae]
MLPAADVALLMNFYVCLMTMLAMLLALRSREACPGMRYWLASVLLFSALMLLLYLRTAGMPGWLGVGVVNALACTALLLIWLGLRAYRNELRSGDHGWLLLPVLLGAALWWLAGEARHFAVRVLLVNAVLMVLVGMILKLVFVQRAPHEYGRACLGGLLAGTMLVLLFRMGSVLLHGAEVSAGKDQGFSILLLVLGFVILGSGYSFLLIQSDWLQERLRQQASLDPLTGLFNRRGMARAGELIMANCQRQQGILTAAMLDLDHFKQINDRLGHAAGDEVLVAVSERLKRQMRGGDVLVRSGGEEFAVLLPGCNLDEARQWAERLRDALATQPLQAGGQLLAVSVSAGLAQWQPGETLDQLFVRADRAMYAAKAAGRNCVRTSAVLDEPASET